MEICKKEDMKKVFDYIGEDYDKCAYLYIDLKKYGIEDENINVWYQKNNDGEIAVIALMYYNGMHVFSRQNVFDVDDLAEFVLEKQPALVCGMSDTVDLIKEACSKDYIPEYGKVLKLEKYSGIDNDEVRPATREEIAEITELLMTDEEMGGPYTYDLLYNQLLERFDTGFGRNWLRRDEKGIVSHCATYAEIDDICVISGGIVRDDYRGTGQYPGQLGAMTRDIVKDGKKIISYYYGGAKTAHKVVGYVILGDWAKLIRQ